MADNDDDAFDKIMDAKTSGNGNWIRDGRYVVCVGTVSFEERHKTGKTWITEFTVLEAVAVNEWELDGRPCKAGTSGAIPVAPNEVGARVSLTLPQKLANGPGDVKKHLVGLLGTTVKEFDLEEAEAKQAILLEEAMAKRGQPVEKPTVRPMKRVSRLIAGPTQAMRGAIIRLETYRTTNQGTVNPANKGNILVLPNWIHIPHVKVDIAARRHAIENSLPIPWPPPVATQASATVG